MQCQQTGYEAGSVQKKNVPFMLLTAYRAAGLHVNRLQDNIEIVIKEIVPMIKLNEKKT